MISTKTTLIALCAVLAGFAVQANGERDALEQASGPIASLESTELTANRFLRRTRIKGAG